MAGVACCAESEPPAAERFDIAGAGSRLHVRGPKASRGDIARHALLQKQFGRLDDRFGMEPRPQRALQQRVGDGDDRHALMMGHEGADDRDALPLRNARGRKVQSLVEAIAPLRPDSTQAIEIRQRRSRVNHGRQRGRVRRNDRLFA